MSLPRPTKSDPDTGYNFGELRGSRKMIAWGGLRFTELVLRSVGRPGIVDQQLDRGRRPVRIPHAAGVGVPRREAIAHPRSSAQTSVTSSVSWPSICSSPPLLSTTRWSPRPIHVGAKVAHVAMLEDDVTASGLDFFNARRSRGVELRLFQPYYPWRVGLSDHEPDRWRRQARAGHLHRQSRGQTTAGPPSARPSRSSTATSTRT